MTMADVLILADHDGGKIAKTAGELANVVNLSYSALSQHLDRMKKLHLIEGEKNGQEVLYSIKSHEVRAILSTLYLIYCR